MLHFAVDQAFDALLGAWRTHYEVTGDPRTTLQRRAEVRYQLDRARDRMHKLRIAVHPEPDELESVVDKVWCESLEAVVHMRLLDRDPRFPGQYRCACDGLVPIDWSKVNPADFT